MKPIRICIADDHPMVITGLHNMLANCPHITVLATYPDGDSLLDGLQQELPDVLLLDIQMPGKTGDELAPHILKKYPGLRILTLTNFDSTLYVRNMMRHGVLGYLLKTTDQETLVTAIETVYEGNEFLESSMQARMEQQAPRFKKEVSSKSAITPRELEILSLIVNEYSNQEIAEKLFLSQRTVENYRQNLLFKLNVKNTAGLVRKAVQTGLVE